MLFAIKNKSSLKHSLTRYWFCAFFFKTTNPKTNFGHKNKCYAHIYSYFTACHAFMKICTLTFDFEVKINTFHVSKYSFVYEILKIYWHNTFPTEAYTAWIQHYLNYKAVHFSLHGKMSPVTVNSQNKITFSKYASKMPRKWGQQLSSIWVLVQRR